MDQKRRLKSALQFDAINHFHQPEAGYRFSTDSILLADFADIFDGAKMADLGAGCGVVGLCALEKKKAVQSGRLFFVEREKSFLDSLEKNLALYQPRTLVELSILAADWRELEPRDFGGPLDRIMVNPPYFPLKSGRPSPKAGREAGRRELHGGLADLCRAISRLLAPDGRADLILPAGRTNELLGLIEAQGLAIETSGQAGAGSPPPVLWRLRKIADQTKIFGRS